MWAEASDLLVLDVRLVRGETIDRASLALLAESRYERLVRDAGSFLHPREFDYHRSLDAPKRQRDFLMGRFAAKQALADLHPSLVARDVDIQPGVFQQPVVIHAGERPLAVCITHSGGLSSAVAFPAGHPIGIDVEAIAPEHLPALKSQIADDELPPSARDRFDVEGYTRVWTIKEALSKILRCGLMSPFSLFRPVDGRLSSDGVFTGGFQHFPQYRFLSLASPRVAFAMVHPARTTPLFDRQRVEQFLTTGMA